MVSEHKNTDFNRADRDLLITLNAKFDQLALQFKDLRDGTLTRIAKLEVRMDAQDVYHAGIPLKRYDELATWVEGFRSNYRLVLFFGGVFLGILGGVASQLLSKIFHF